MSHQKRRTLDEERAFAYGATMKLSMLMKDLVGGMDGRADQEANQAERVARSAQIFDDHSVRTAFESVEGAKRMIDDWAKNDPRKISVLIAVVADKMHELDQQDAAPLPSPPNVAQLAVRGREAHHAHARDTSDLAVAEMILPEAFARYIRIARTALAAYRYVPAVFPFIRDGVAWAVSVYKKIKSSRERQRLLQIGTYATNAHRNLEAKHAAMTPPKMIQQRRSASRRSVSKPSDYAQHFEAESARKALSSDMAAAAAAAEPEALEHAPSIVRNSPSHAPQMVEEEKVKEPRQGKRPKKVKEGAAAAATAAAEGAGIPMSKFIVFDKEKWSKPRAKKYLVKNGFAARGNAKQTNTAFIFKVSSKKKIKKNMKMSQIGDGIASVS